MIRPCLPQYIDAIVQMIQKTDTTPPEGIRECLLGWNTFLWEESGTPLSVACYSQRSEGQASLRLYTDPDARYRGFGSQLLEASLAALGIPERRIRVTTRYRLDEGDSQRFFRKRGFTYWYSMDLLKYDGPPMPEEDLPPNVEIRQYEDEHFGDFFRVMGDAFFPQRAFFDFRPHNVREQNSTEAARKRALANKDNMLVLLDEGRLVGIAELEGNTIDTLGVDRETRGRGYGRALLRHAVNLLRERGHHIVETSVVLGNIPAWRLYNEQGFRRVQINEWACLWP